jgi:hypothetical protein
MPLNAKAYLITLLCVAFSYQYVLASDMKKQSESDGTVSEQSVVAEARPAPSPFGNLAGRSRIGASFGFRSGNAQQAILAGYGNTVISGAENLAMGFGYSYWLREDLALNVAMSILAPEVGIRSGPVAITTNGVVAVLAGVRWYFSDTGYRTVRPYLNGSVGPYIGSDVEVRSLTTKDVTLVAPGGRAGAGFDVQLQRDFMLGVRGGYNFMSDFSRPLAGRDNYSGFEIGVELSWVFGESRPAK